MAEGNNKNGSYHGCHALKLCAIFCVCVCGCVAEKTEITGEKSRQKAEIFVSGLSKSTSLSQHQVSRDHERVHIC